LKADKEATIKLQTGNYCACLGASSHKKNNNVEKQRTKKII